MSDPTPVAAYNFDADTGTTVTDNTGNGNTLTFVDTGGGIAWATPGALGGTDNNYITVATQSNGTYLSTPAVDALQPDTTVSLMAWVMPSANTSGANRAVLVKGVSSNFDSYGLYFSDTQQLIPGCDVLTTVQGYSCDATDALTVDTWAHLAMTYDGATLAFYVNGELVNSIAATGSLVYDTNDLTVLGSTAWPNESSAGSIDDARIFNVVLTQAQIQTLMGERVSPPTPPPTPAFNLFNIPHGRKRWARRMRRYAYQQST